MLNIYRNNPHGEIGDKMADVVKKAAEVVSNPLDANVVAGKLDLLDVGGAVLAKTLFTEPILNRVVGNSTLISAGAKLVGAALVTTMLKGRVGNILSLALGLDGAEDAVLMLLNKGGVGSGANINEAAW